MFAALAVARYLQDATGMSIKKIVRTLRPLQDITVVVNGHRLAARPQLDQTVRDITEALAH